MMWDAIHFFRRDLGGTDIHMAVNLHGIRGNDLSVYCFARAMESFVFPTAVGPVSTIRGFFIYFLRLC